MAMPPAHLERSNPVIDERNARRPCDSPEVRFAAKFATDLLGMGVRVAEVRRELCVASCLKRL